MFIYDCYRVFCVFFLPFRRKKHVNSLVNGNYLVLLNIPKYHAITDVVHKGLRVKDI